jgi:tRNA pseudouridine38-40 synthase
LRYFFHIGYRGLNYQGWQKNGQSNSIQKLIEDKLAQILKKPIIINGCGRTDAKVSASQFFFHADIDQDIEETFFFRLNKSLPNDIAVFDIIPMDGLPHARFDAIQRQYDYFIHNYKDPFLSDCSSQYLVQNMDFEKLKSATALLLKYNDYRPFCTSPDKNDHTICHISKAQWLISSNGKRFRFQVSSNRFLGKMIRILVGQLLKVGKRELSITDFENYFIYQKTPKILSPAHPQGLYLSKITYPYLDLNPKSDFLNLDFGADIWKKL